MPIPFGKKETLFRNSRKQKPQNQKKEKWLKKWFKYEYFPAGTEQTFFRGDSSPPPPPPRSHPLSFYTPFLTEKVLSYTFY